VDSASILEIEEIAFHAWPAAEVVDLSGWRLRFMHGVTRRANSVWPNAWQGEMPLAERLEAVEAFARARGIAPSFQVTKAAKPGELDDELAARGYAIDAPVIVKTLELAARPRSAVNPELEATVFSSPHADWLGIAVSRSRYAGAREHFLGLLDRLGPRAGCALVRSGGVPVATGLGVTDGPWLGIFAMVTVPEARRQGAARAALRALASWGAERGAKKAYLQVERANDAARALYRAAGFSAAYDYHYRTLFSP
jgi:ribosomal protein S18 acetylase RimI-like enzyme